MPIQRLELRGISHLPSDRMTADGGVAESINFMLENGENVPMVMPEDITSGTVGQYGEYKPVYVHKTASYSNYIGLSDSGELAYLTVPGYWNPGLALLGEEQLLSVNSIGNILVVQTSEHTEYFFFKEGEYLPLGDKIPEPVVEFRSFPKGIDIESQKIEDFVTDADTATAIKLLYRQDKETFNKQMSKYGTTLKYDMVMNIADGTKIDVSIPVTETVNGFSRAIWDWVNSKIVYQRNEGKFCRPVFARYAVKLYDGSYVYSSVPVLLGLGGEASDRFCDVTTIPSTAYGDYSMSAQVVLSNLYEAEYRVKYDIPEAWKDLISSVDVFLSTELDNPEISAPFKVSLGAPPLASTYRGYTTEQKRTTEEELLSRSNFYRIESLEVNSLQTGGWIIKEIKPLSQDELVVKPRLDFDYRSSFNPQPAGGNITYNNRLIGFGLRETLARGYRFHQAASYAVSESQVVEKDPQFSFRYYIKTEEGEVKTVFAHYGASEYVEFPHGDSDTSHGNYWMTLYGLLMYPDSRCYQVEVTNLQSKVASILPMKPHPNLDCAYFFCGNLTKKLEECLEDAGSAAVNESAEDPLVVSHNRLIMSEVDNPFVFSLGGRIRVGSRILAAAPTTTALATGQYDQAPLYIFTEEGIEAQRINTDGTFGPHSFVSRDVAHADTICPIDQAIVFTTERGVMMLTQGNIECLSPNMNGKIRQMDPSARLQLSPTWMGLVDEAQTIDNFHKFISDVHYVYDYAGRRLVCINPSVRYQYVYHFSTQTWHKMASLSETRILSAVNSYPESHAVAGKRQLRLTDLSSSSVAQGNIMEYLAQMDRTLPAEEVEGFAGGTLPLSIDVYPERKVQAMMQWLSERNIVFWEYYLYGISNLSTYREENSEQSTMCLLVSRAFDLGFPDVRKSIKEIKLRGYFNRKDVRYMLLGSMDGINYRLTHSRGGSSFKSYKLVVLGTLEPDETLSWVDVEFEPRFNNKLR